MFNLKITTIRPLIRLIIVNLLPMKIGLMTEQSLTDLLVIRIMVTKMSKMEDPIFRRSKDVVLKISDILIKLLIVMSGELVYMPIIQDY